MIFKRITPKNTAQTIKILFKIPSAPKDNLSMIVEMIKPEFRITLLKSSECKKENNKRRTSTKISIVKKSSKNTLLISLMSNTNIPIELKQRLKACNKFLALGEYL